MTRRRIVATLLGDEALCSLAIQAHQIASAADPRQPTASLSPALRDAYAAWKDDPEVARTINDRLAVGKS